MSVGTFTPKHVGREALRESVRVVRPNGLLCLSLRDDFLLDGANGLGDCLAGLVSSGALEPVHMTEPELYTPRVSQDITFRCWLYRVAVLGAPPKS